jgi:hypothetical protein
LAVGFFFIAAPWRFVMDMRKHSKWSSKKKAFEKQKLPVELAVDEFWVIRPAIREKDESGSENKDEKQ